MRKKGFSFIELLIVLVILGIISAVFSTLIYQMVQTGTLILGKKSSYQQARDALKLVADEIRYNIRGGTNHNLGVSGPCGSSIWQTECSYACSSSRFSFFPDRNDYMKRVRFTWYSGGQTGLGWASGPDAWAFQRWESTSETSVGTITQLAYVKDEGNPKTKGALTVKYYNASGNPISITGAGLTHAQAQTVSLIELILTIQKGPAPVKLSETVFIRERGLPPPG